MGSKHPDEKFGDTTSADPSISTEKPHVHDDPNMPETYDKQDPSNTSGGDDDTIYPSGLKLVLILISLCLAVFLVALDQTIIAPALGTITAEYGSVKDIGWYGASYLLTTTALQPMYGTIYKLFSIKYAYLTAIAIFEIGSLVCALAPTSTAFIVGRAIAGIGTAGLFSGSIVILSYTMPLEKRPLAFGLIGGMWGVASVAGPLLGGVFTEKATWRWCFYINLPIGGLAMLFIFFLLTISRKNNPNGDSLVKRILQLDLIGTAIFLPAIVCLILALQWGGAEYPWNSAKIIGLFVGFALMIIVFIGIQLWQGDKGTLPPKLFKNRNVVCAMLFACFFGAAFFPLLYYLCKCLPNSYPRLCFQQKNPDSKISMLTDCSALLPGNPRSQRRPGRHQDSAAPPRNRRRIHCQRRPHFHHWLLQRHHPPVSGPLCRWLRHDHHL